MGMMQVTIALVWNPQPQWNDGELPVQALPAGGVSVDDLVLQGAVQGNEECDERHDDPE
jgi:hypothetical protein